MVPTIILTYMPPSDAFPNPMVLGHAAENGAQQMHLLPGEAWVVQVYLGAHGQFTFGLIALLEKLGLSAYVFGDGGLDAQETLNGRTLPIPWLRYFTFAPMV